MTFLEEVRAVLRPLVVVHGHIERILPHSQDDSEWAVRIGDLRAARSLLSRLEAQSGEALRWPWETIDTAPSEGDVMVFGGRHERVEAIHADGAYWRYARKEGSRSVPTHWMPLPPPPHVAPPASASSGSGRAEFRDVRVPHHLEWWCGKVSVWLLKSEPLPKAAPDGSTLAMAVAAGSQEIVRLRADNALVAHNNFIAGRRSMQEEAARVVSQARTGEIDSDLRSVAAAVRALNPETKP